MEPFPSAANLAKEQALLSDCLTRLRQQLLERGEHKDFFETRVEERFYCLNFTNAIILSCLALDPETAPLRERMCQRLIQEISPHGTVNYRMRSISSVQASPYPDDLDDTFCTLAAIFLHDKTRLSPELLAQATLALTATEAEPGGPYRTWLVAPQSQSIWRDIDPVVNANIAFFLQLHGIRLPKLDNYLEAQISLPASPYYPSPLHVLYFLSRGLKGSTHDKHLEALLLACRPTNILERAMLISSLLRCQSLEAAQALIPEFLQELEQGQGLQAFPICVDTVAGDVKHFATCPELTAALCIEALCSLEGARRIQSPVVPAIDPSPALIDQARTLICVTNDPTLQALIESFFSKLASNPLIRELTNLPLDFARAWNASTATIPQQTLEKLCLAHLLGWIAYTLYDDILDGDGTVALLSVANIASRQMYQLFSNLELDVDYENFYRQTLNDMDEANALEVLHARLPVSHIPKYADPKTLFARSGGIILSPVAVLRLAGYAQTAVEITQLKTFFENYLAAKQLNDDAHDWQEDLSRGHVTAVVSKLLERSDKAYNPDDLKNLQSDFWEHVILVVCQDIQSYVAKAREAMRKFGKVEHPDFFNKLIDPLEASAKKALSEREQSLAFLCALDA